MSDSPASETPDICYNINLLCKRYNHGEPLTNIERVIAKSDEEGATPVANDLADMHNSLKQALEIITAYVWIQEHAQTAPIAASARAQTIYPEARAFLEVHKPE